MLALLPAHVGSVLKHMLPTDERFRARISKTDIAAWTDDRCGGLKGITRVSPRYLGPYRIRELLGEQKLAGLGKPESIFANDGGHKYHFGSEVPQPAGNHVPARKGVLRSTDA